MTDKERSIAKALFARLQQLVNSEFFSRDEAHPRVSGIIGWWEMRRLPYNLLVGAAGVITCAVCLVTGLLCEHFLDDPIGLPNPPIFAFFVVLAYGIMANVCYTGGWISELIVQKLWPAQGEAFGKISFFLGLIFSILLTLAPGAFVAVVGAVRLSAHFLGK